MTTLLAWTGVDTHGPSSIYIASDSRITWTSNDYWDEGRKIFSSTKHPEIFGYSGSVSFPIQILGQIIELIDNELLFEEFECFQSKLDKIRANIEKSYQQLPRSHQLDSEIFYASRVGIKMDSSFHFGKIVIIDKTVTSEEVSLPSTSDLLASTGSGKTALTQSHSIWTGSVKKTRTSRYVFGALCDALKSGEDKKSGGAPQLVGLYRVGPANSYGIIYNNKRYLNGKETKHISSHSKLEWRNNLFEECCGHTMRIKKNAQRQPKP